MPLVRELAGAGIKLNVTALMTVAQVRQAITALRGGPAAYISLFAGRVADSGRDPLPPMTEAVQLMAADANLELIWASPPRIDQHLPGGRDWLPRDYGLARRPGQALARRQGSR